jgi:hypothetical protein
VKLTRRSVIGASAALCVPGGISVPARAADAVSIRIDPVKRLPAIPADFMGLGYEISSVAVPGLLSAKNRAYVQLVRNLGRGGVIRVGGNTSDFSSYDAKGEPKSLPKGTVVNEANFRELRTFLDATGWKLIWGINLGDDKLDNAVAEARAIVETMGDRLLALEIGNEPDLFVQAGHRKEPYGYAEWLAEYRRYKAAIRAQLPRVPFAGPDLAGRGVDWMANFARDEGRDAVLLTAHHYIQGQANPTSTLELMLQEEKKFQPALAQFQAASQAAHLPWRMCETASYSGGGKEGASDTFAASLWALDYLFVLANYGCAGVNMETGVNHLGWVSHYTPIGDDLGGHFSAAPEYYGLLAFARAGFGERLGVVLDTAGVNLTAYATERNGETMVTVINRDMARGASIDVSGTRFARADAWRLSAPSPSATTGVTFGGAMMGAAGKWSGGKTEALKVSGAHALLDVPAASGAVIRLRT